MRRLAELGMLTLTLWACLFLLAYAMTVGLMHHGPTQFLAALYVGTTGPLAASWAVGVAAPIGARCDRCS